MRSAACLGVLCLLALRAHASSDPFVDEVVRFQPGEHAGFGSPELVLGPPVGAGATQGSTHTLSLGDGGSIVVRFDEPGLCDGPGADFVVFENAFHAGSADGPLFFEVGIVAVSVDGVAFVEFPYDARTYVGLAGRTPVFSHPDNGIDPTHPEVAGGDVFDLAAVGLSQARYVRISDPGMAIPDPGNRVVPGTSGGFDLDALASLHSCEAPAASPTATPSPSPSPSPSPEPDPTTPPALSPTSTLTAAATATPTPPSPPPSKDTATPTPTPPLTATATTPPSPTPGHSAADIDGNGKVEERDLRVVVAAIFDGGTVSADANRDLVVSGADVVTVLREWNP